MHQHKQPAAVPALCAAIEQPHQRSGQQTKQRERERDFQDATAPLLTLALPYPIQLQRNAVQPAVKEVVVEEQRLDVDCIPCKCQPTAT